MSEEPFLGCEAPFLYHCGAFAYEAHVGDVVSEHGGVCGHGFAARPSDKHVDGLSDPLAFEVPQRDVESGNRHHGFAVSTVNRGSMHDVPEEFCG